MASGQDLVDAALVERIAQGDLGTCLPEAPGQPRELDENPELDPPPRDTWTRSRCLDLCYAIGKKGAVRLNVPGHCIADDPATLRKLDAWAEELQEHIRDMLRT